MGPFNYRFTKGNIRPNLSARYGRNPAFLWLATEAQAPELISGIRPTFAGTPAFGPVGPFGGAVRLQTSSDSLTFAALDRHRMQATQFSCFFCFRTDNGGASYRPINLTGTGGWSIESGASASSGLRIDASGIGSSTAVTKTADAWATFGMNWITGSTYNVMMNGPSSTATGTLSYTTPPATNTVRFTGPTIDCGAGRGCSIAVMAIWNRVITLQELFQLDLDYRELFRPMRYWSEIDASATSPPPPPSNTNYLMPLVGVGD